MDVKSDMVAIFKKAEKAIVTKLPFVMYRHPESNLVKAVFQKNDELFYIKDYQERGFVFAPFDNNEPSILFPFSESTLLDAEITKIIFEDKSNMIIMPSASEDSKKKHTELVKHGIEFLENNGVKKVVLSRKVRVELQRFEVINTFKKLLLSYKNAFVYCWYHPQVGLWLGATPETLLKANDRTFSTMALAGTQAAKKDKDITWKPKEIQEQQLVTDFILEKLGGNIRVSKPYTVKAGSLLHLRTDISGRLTGHLTLKGIINLLHPTPAVCGVPRQKAKDFILQNENYNRQFYTGFLGELNFNNTSNLFVNLRCMQVSKKQLEIYVGGGITIHSNPESEWKETVAKSKVMMYILH